MKKNTTRLFWKLKATTPAFAKEVLSDMRNIVPADAFMMQPGSGVRVIEVAYGISSRFGSGIKYGPLV